MKRLLASLLLASLLSAPVLAGSSWGSGGLVPGDSGKPVIVHPWVGHEDDIIKLDDPIIIIDIGPAEEDEGIVFIGRVPLHRRGGLHALNGREAN